MTCFSFDFIQTAEGDGLSFSFTPFCKVISSKIITDDWLNTNNDDDVLKKAAACQSVWSRAVIISQQETVS